MGAPGAAVSLKAATPELAQALDDWYHRQRGKNALLPVDQALAIGLMAVQFEMRSYAATRDDEDSVCGDWRRALQTLKRLQKDVSDASHDRTEHSG